VALLLERETAVAAWRRAEARVYPTVMVNAELYQQYIGVVRAVAEELRDATSEQELVAAWVERRDVVEEVVSRSAPPMLALMDREAIRDAAFCHRHRQVNREHGKQLARERLEEARRTGAEWVVLFDDVTPLGSQQLEMHVATGRALHTSSELPLDASRPSFRLEVVQLDPVDGAWLLDKPPLMPAKTYDTHDELEARVAQARALFGRT
jgi:hypothetical protein